jgi:hypothetical protein
MLETLFSSTSPIWTVPNIFPFPAPMGVGSRPITAPVFAPATMPSSSGGPLGSTLSVGLNPLAGGPIALDPGLPAASLLAVVAVRRGQPQGPTTEQEVEDFIYDALELVPGAGEVEVRCENGRATLTGTVQHKRVKHDAGEIAWAIPGLSDVQNNVTITSRRRARAAGRESEAPAARKQA